MTPRDDLTAPGGTASSAANATVSSCQRAPSSRPDASASSTAVPIIVRCVPDERDEHDRRAERAEDAADRREPVEASRDRSRVLDRRQREPDRERAHHPEQRHRNGEQRERREERADRRADRGRVELATVASRNGRATNGITAIASAATSTILPSRTRCGRRSASRPPNQ